MHHNSLTDSSTHNKIQMTLKSQHIMIHNAHKRTMPYNILENK